MPDRLSPEAFAKLRSWRVYADRDTSIASDLRSTMRAVASRQRSDSAALAAWEQVAPEVLRRACRVSPASGGALRVKASGAAARFQLDRWLRSGGGEQLRRAGVARVVLA